MKIHIHDAVLASFPETTLGVVVAETRVEPTHPYIDTLQRSLGERLRSLGIEPANIAAHPDIAGWREVYRSFGVKPSKYRSSVESLMRRVLRGQDPFRISSVVDLYNCVSVHSVLPFGAYDLAKIDGDIELRFGVPGEIFRPLGSADEEIEVNEQQVVYADDSKVLCYLWNYRDSREAAIKASTRRAIFFVDAAFRPKVTPVEKAVELLASHLPRIGATVQATALLSATQPGVDIESPVTHGSTPEPGISTSRVFSRSAKPKE